MTTDDNIRGHRRRASGAIDMAFALHLEAGGEPEEFVYVFDPPIAVRIKRLGGTPEDKGVSTKTGTPQCKVEVPTHVAIHCSRARGAD
jgi:hypothetical protein